MTDQENQENQENRETTEVQPDYAAREYRGEEIYAGEYEVRVGVVLPKKKYLNMLAKLPSMILLIEAERIEKLTVLQKDNPEAPCHWQHQATFDETKFRSENEGLFPTLGDEEAAADTDEETGPPTGCAPMKSGASVLGSLIPGAKKEKDGE